MSYQDDFFDNWAAEYDQKVLSPAEQKRYPFAAYTDVLRTILDLAKPRIGLKVLDLGLGTAILTEQMYRQNCEVYGLDFSEEMIKIAQAKMPRAKLVKADIKAGLPQEWQNKKFDLVLFTYSIHHFSDDFKVKLINSLLPNLEAGAKIIIGDVMCQNELEMSQAREKDLEIWDDSEDYIVVDSLVSKLSGFRYQFHQKSYCSGVLSLQKLD